MAVDKFLHIFLAVVSVSTAAVSAAVYSTRDSVDWLQFVVLGLIVAVWVDKFVDVFAATPGETLRREAGIFRNFQPGRSFQLPGASFRERARRSLSYKLWGGDEDSSRISGRKASAGEDNFAGGDENAGSFRERARRSLSYKLWGGESGDDEDSSRISGRKTHKTGGEENFAGDENAGSFWERRRRSLSYKRKYGSDARGDFAGDRSDYFAGGENVDDEVRRSRSFGELDAGEENVAGGCRERLRRSLSFSLAGEDLSAGEDFQSSPATTQRERLRRSQSLTLGGDKKGGGRQFGRFEHFHWKAGGDDDLHALASAKTLEDRQEEEANIVVRGRKKRVYEQARSPSSSSARSVHFHRAESPAKNPGQESRSPKPAKKSLPGMIREKLLRSVQLKRSRAKKGKKASAGQDLPPTPAVDIGSLADIDLCEPEEANDKAAYPVVVYEADDSGWDESFNIVESWAGRLKPAGLLALRFLLVALPVGLMVYALTSSMLATFGITVVTVVRLAFAFGLIELLAGSSDAMKLVLELECRGPAAVKMAPALCHVAAN